MLGRQRVNNITVNPQENVFLKKKFWHIIGQNHAIRKLTNHPKMMSSEMFDRPGHVLTSAQSLDSHSRPTVTIWQATRKVAD